MYLFLRELNCEFYISIIYIITCSITHNIYDNKKSILLFIIVAFINEINLNKQQKQVAIISKIRNNKLNKNNKKEPLCVCVCV